MIKTKVTIQQMAKKTSRFPGAPLKFYPTLQLRGKQLKEAGFLYGMEAKVSIEQNKITIEL